MADIATIKVAATAAVAVAANDKQKHKTKTSDSIAESLVFLFNKSMSYQNKYTNPNEATVLLFAPIEKSFVLSTTLEEKVVFFVCI